MNSFSEWRMIYFNKNDQSLNCNKVNNLKRETKFLTDYFKILTPHSGLFNQSHETKINQFLLLIYFFKI